MKLHLITFGFYHGIPDAASLILDCRCIRDPNERWEFNDQNGLSPDVQGQVMTHPMAVYVVAHAHLVIKYRFLQEHKQQFTYGIGCVAGVHRSVAVAEYLKVALPHFTELKDIEIIVMHRDISKPWTGGLR